MHRPHKVFVAFGFAATLLAPATVQAQPGERPATQLFLGPTGRVLPKGDGYMKAMAFSVPFFQGGLTDRLSIGVGMPIFGLGYGVMITPKFQVHRSSTSATAIGVLQVVTVGGSGGVAYAAHTQGTNSGALHVGVLTPYGSDSGFRHFALMVGAERRINNRVTFMTENYFMGGGAMISAGLRMKAPHTTWDLGWMTLPGLRAQGPLINVGYKF